MKELRVGFITNAFTAAGMTSLPAIASWASSNGFSEIEVGPAFPPDRHTLGTVAGSGVRISALIYCRNLLSLDIVQAELHQEQIRRRIEVAGELGIGIVTISAGFDKHQLQPDIYDNYEAIRPLPEKSMDAFLRVYEPLVRLAEKNGVQLAIENCPLMGNWAISPPLWRLAFTRLDSPALGLAFDPSHLVWQMIDPYAALLEFKDKIFHFHAKDAQVSSQALARTGILSDFSWWEYRIPGSGSIDWKRMLSLLDQINYNGSITVENEDPRYIESLELVQKGLVLATEHLRVSS